MTSGLNVQADDFGTDRWNSQQWDALASQFPAMSIYQLGLYGELHSPGRFRDYSRAALLGDGGRPVALLQMRVKRLPLQRGGVADGDWGPLWESLDPLAAFLQRLRKEYVEKRKMELRLTPVSTCSEAQDKELVQCLQEQGFRRNSDTRPYHTVVIDLDRSLDDIRAGFHQKWRNQLNVAEKAGLQHEFGTSNEFFDRFLRIYERMWESKKFPTGVRVPVIHRMHRSLPEAQKLVVTIVKDGDTDLGATVCAAYGSRMLYFLGATMPAVIACAMLSRAPPYGSSTARKLPAPWLCAAPVGTLPAGSWLWTASRSVALAGDRSRACVGASAAAAAAPSPLPSARRARRICFRAISSSLRGATSIWPSSAWLLVASRSS